MERRPDEVVSGRVGTTTLLVGALLLGGICGTSPVFAATLYVRTNGSDTNDGLSVINALRTITHAAAIAKSGDRIVVGPGTYKEGNILAPRQGLARIRFVADRRGLLVGEPAGDVLVDATTFAAGFVLNHDLGITIDGFVVYGAVNGIYVKSQSDQALISNNIVCNNGSNGTGNGIYIQDSGGAVVFNNLVYNNGGSGILVTGSDGGSPAVRVINNTVDKNGNRGIFFAGTTNGSPGGLVLNNITAENATVGMQVNASSRDGYVSAGNVFADGGASGTPIDVTDRRGDPLFVNEDPSGPDHVLGGAGYADDDFHLQQRAAGQAATSPAVDNGSDQVRRLKLSRTTTRTDGRADSGYVDAGYHYHNFDSVPQHPELSLRHASLYVNPTTGADINDGRSPSQALQSLARAFDVAKPGDQILLQPGTYQEGHLTLTNSGTQGRDIMIQAMPGAKIDASGFSHGILISGRSDVTLVGLDISGASDSGIEIRTNSSNVTVLRCRLHNNAIRGLKVTDSTAVTAQADIIEANSSRGIEVENGTVDVVRSLVKANATQGLWALDNAEVTVDGSAFVDNVRSGVQAEASSVTMSNSTIRGGGDGGARFLNGSSGALTGVSVSNTADAGIQGVSSVVNVTGGAVEGNVRVGIEGIVDVTTLGSNQLTVSGTRVCNNHGPGVHAQDTGAMLTDVTLCQNDAEGLRQENGSLQMRGGVVTQNHSKGISVSDADAVNVQGVQITANSDRGVQVYTSHQVSFTGTISAVNASEGIVVFDSSGPESGPEIVNNLVYGNSSSGIVISGGVSGSPNAQVLNNTVYGNGDRGVVIGGGNDKPPSGGARVLRNIFQGNATYGLQVNELSLLGYSGDYNLSADQYPDSMPPGTHDIFTSEAMFVDPTGAAPDFHLSQRAAGQQVTSPAVDAGGVDVSAAELHGTTTRTDGVADTGTVDLGYHYPQ